MQHAQVSADASIHVRAVSEAQAAANKLLVLLSYERHLRDRNSQMEAPGADFRYLFKLVEQADQRQAAKQQQQVVPRKLVPVHCSSMPSLWGSVLWGCRQIRQHAMNARIHWLPAQTASASKRPPPPPPGGPSSRCSTTKEL